MGVPVVATDVGGVAECVNDGLNGYVVPSGKPKALGKRIARLLNDPAEAISMGNQGRKDVETRFGVDSQLAKIEAVFEKVTGHASTQKPKRSAA